MCTRRMAMRAAAAGGEGHADRHQEDVDQSEREVTGGERLPGEVQTW